MAGSGRKNAHARLITALASGATNAAAARVAGVGERTVYRRLADPGFRRAVDAERAAIMARATAMLSALSIEAVAKLRELLSAESESVRLGAVRSILELGTKLRESTEMEQRIAELEERLLHERPERARWGI